jgi:hypothetical protein
MPHAPALHAAVAFAGTGQTLPHTPQLLRSVEVFFSQPSTALLLQSAKGALHVSLQAPAVQTDEAFGA